MFVKEVVCSDKQGVFEIKISMHSSRKDVENFLQELRGILTDPDFSIEADLTLIVKRKPGHEQFSTPYTMMDLDYDEYDVVERLKELTYRDYSETLHDDSGAVPPLLFVFGKDINKRQVYIKLKIKDVSKKKVLCLSFHYAENKMNFPYR